jgi:hypothetical protein
MIFRLFLLPRRLRAMTATRVNKPYLSLSLSLSLLPHYSQEVLQLRCNKIVLLNKHFFFVTGKYPLARHIVFYECSWHSNAMKQTSNKDFSLVAPVNWITPLHLVSPKPTYLLLILNECLPVLPRRINFRNKVQRINSSSICHELKKSVWFV